MEVVEFCLGRFRLVLVDLLEKVLLAVAGVSSLRLLATYASLPRPPPKPEGRSMSSSSRSLRKRFVRSRAFTRPAMKWRHQCPPHETIGVIILLQSIIIIIIGILLLFFFSFFFFIIITILLLLVVLTSYYIFFSIFYYWTTLSLLLYYYYYFIIIIGHFHQPLFVCSFCHKIGRLFPNDNQQ